MPNSYTTIDLLAGSSGTNAVNQTVFGPFAFDYINDADVRFAVKVSSVWQIISVASFNATTKLVTLSATPQTAHSAAHTDEARIYRSTSLSPIVDFQSGSRISEADLDNAYRQGLFAAQEATEDAPGSASRTVQATDDIANSAIDASKLATNAVETLKIKDLNVTTGKLAAEAVETAKIDDGAVTPAKLANEAVETAKIDDGAVTPAKMAGTLDLSGKTLTFPSGGIVQGEVDTATKAEMEGESAAGVCVPATLKNHPGIAKAHGVVTFDTSTPALVAGSYNIASVVEAPTVSEDVRRITFTNAMANTTYTVVVSAEGSLGDHDPYVLAGRTTTYFDLYSSEGDATGRALHFTVFGQLA